MNRDSNPQPADLMCECPSMLINEWLGEAGEVLETRELAPGDAGERDAVEFLSSSATKWRIVCPTCRATYVSGVRPQTI